MRSSVLVCATLLLACTSSQPAPSASKSQSPAVDAPEPMVEDVPAVAPDEPRIEHSQVLDELVPPAERIEIDETLVASLRIEVRDFDLWVTDGSRRAKLQQRATDLIGVKREKGAGGEPVLVVDYVDGMLCTEGQDRLTLPVRSLLARLENAAAMRDHRKKDYEASARGFAQAALLDPSLELPWSNLACALALQGRTAEAVASLGPLIERDPLRTYHKVLRDPELASIREEAVITALRAPEPGNASVRGLTMAHSPSRSLVALWRQEQSWGSCAFVAELELFDTTTGERVAMLPLIHWSDTDPDCDGGDEGSIKKGRRAEVDARLDVADRFLKDMGFSVVEGLEQVEVKPADTDGGAIYRARFPKARLGVAIGDERARVLRGNEVLGVSEPFEYQGFSGASYDAEAGVVVLAWYRSVAEGCDDGGAGTGFTVIPVRSGESRD